MFKNANTPRMNKFPTKLEYKDNIQKTLLKIKIEIKVNTLIVLEIF